MRVLYDTSVLVSILSRREAIWRFKKQITGGVIANISSEYILAEVEAVLCEKFNITRQKARTAARLLGRQSIIVSPKHIAKVCRDPFDDYILATALEGKASYIVTADKDLLVLGEYKGIRIAQLADFEEELDN
jgi:putative PIN family toxin of toxin-antitoxin system